MSKIQGVDRRIEESTGASVSSFIRREEKIAAQEIGFKIHSELDKAIHGMWQSYNETLVVINERMDQDYRIATKKHYDEEAKIREAVCLNFAMMAPTSMMANSGSNWAHSHLNSAV